MITLHPKVAFKLPSSSPFPAHVGVNHVYALVMRVLVAWRVVSCDLRVVSCFDSIAPLLLATSFVT